MLNSNLIQNNIASLHSVSEEAEKLKKESTKNQSSVQNKIDNKIKQENISVNATGQDSNPQKIFPQDEEHEKKEKHDITDENKEPHHHKKEIFKDNTKGNIVDIKC